MIQLATLSVSVTSYLIHLQVFNVLPTRKSVKISAFLMTLIITGCTTQFTNKDPTGVMFPNVSGESLENDRVAIPELFADKEVLLLLGYVQNAQFDIDRWLIGLDMTETRVDVYELPTIAGMFPQFFKTQINNGMRAGIPKELWKGVITVYEDGESVQAFTGNVNPNNARVILLDKQGKVKYFYDRGFSVTALNQVKNLLN